MHALRRSLSIGSPEWTPPALSYGFRPFFLLAGLYAALAMAAWILFLAFGSRVSSYSFSMAPPLWHGHEMLFGYAVAALSGFLLTAVPSWTGARPVTGLPLLALAGLWLAGRIAMWFSEFLPPLLVMLLDMAYLPLLAVAVAAGLLVRATPRNLPFLGFLALLVLANGAIHWEWIGWTDGTASWGLTVALMVYAALIVIIGGRVVPAFTRNALSRPGKTSGLPSSYPPLEAFSIGSALLLLAAYVLLEPSAIHSVIAAIAAVANGIRLSLWRTDAVLRDPILWSLHLGYAFLVAGYAAIAAADLLGLGNLLALHVLGVGAVGGMTLAIMTRAALGHTGRRLQVRGVIALVYGLVAGAALLRTVGVALFPGLALQASLLAGVLWTLGFALFAWVYLPILVGPPLTTTELS